MAFEMSWRAGAAVALGGFFLVGCGPAVAPIAKASPPTSPTPTQQVEATPASTAVSVQCSAPGTEMAVVAGQYIYDVADPLHPRLVCRAQNTYLHLDGASITYTNVVAGKTVVVRRDLSNGAETQIVKLPATVGGSKSWTSDGKLAVYAVSGAPSGPYSTRVQMHLWSNGADHVLYTFSAGPGDLSGRWSALPVVAFSPDHKRLAISDSICCIASYSVRIFSVADRRQLMVTGTPGLHALGGTWIGNDRFVWASGAGSLMQWTPSAGATLFRSERWHGPSSSPDGRWLAGTLLIETYTEATGYVTKPSARIVSVTGGATFTTGLGSDPAFVTATVVWYSEEGPNSDPGLDPTWPNGTIRAFDVTSGSDQVVTFRAGDAPALLGFAFCCSTRI